MKKTLGWSGPRETIAEGISAVCISGSYEESTGYFTGRINYIDHIEHGADGECNIEALLMSPNPVKWKVRPVGRPCFTPIGSLELDNAFAAFIERKLSEAYMELHSATSSWQR